MKRIYFLVPDIATTKKIVDDLLLARIEEKHIHVLTKRGTPPERVDEIEACVKNHLPTVEIEGTEPKVPAFP